MRKSHTAAILLRKVAGRFDACHRAANFGLVGAAGSAAPLPLAGLTGVFLMILAVVAVVAALASGTFGLGEAFALATAPVAATQSDIKDISDKLMKAFEDFKAKNDERLKAGDERADTLLKAETDKINTRVGELQKELAEAVKASARPAMSTEPASKEQAARMQHVREFLAMTRNVAVDDVQVSDGDLEGIKNYGKHLRNYLRTGEVNAALSVGSQPDGGFLVRPDTSGRIVELVYESSPLRQYASVDTIGTDAFEGGTDLNEAGAGWVGETEERGETATPKIGEWRIPVHEVYAEPHATQKMLDDTSRDVEGWLARKVAEKFGRMEMTAGISGDGNKKWTGILTYVSSAKPTAANWKRIEYTDSGLNGGFPTANPADRLIDMVHKLKTVYRAGAIFFGNNLTLAAMRKIKDAEGRYIFQPDMVGGFQGRALGYPLVDFADMPDLATNSYSLGFGNLREGYQIVDRLGIRVLRDPLTKKGWVKFYTTKRSGGDVVNFEAIKVMRFTT